MTDSVSQNMSHTYRFDVSVCIGPISSLLTSANHSKTFCMLRTRDARIQLNGLENFSFSYDCLTRVLKRFQDMCMSTKRRVCTNLLFGLGYSMIESVKKLHRRLFCKNGTGSNIRSSRAPLLPWNLQAVMAAPDASRTGWGTVNRGGRPAKASQPADSGGTPQPDSAAARPGPGGRPHSHSPCPRTRTSRQKCAPGSSRWVHLASATFAAQSCRRICDGLVNQCSRW